MKKLLLLPILFLAACTTAQQTEVQQVATTVRQVEGWFPEPDAFNVYYDLVTKGNATATANAAKVKAEYADLYSKGTISVNTVETLATQFDTK